MAEKSDLSFNIDVSEALKILEVSQLAVLLVECRRELERRLFNEE